MVPRLFPIHHLVDSYLTPSNRVLELSCGSSQICGRLYKDGITQTTGIDISPAAVEKMQKRPTAKALMLSSRKGP